MVKRKVLIACLIILLLSTGVVFAAGVNGDYKGFPIVNVTLNGEPVTSTVPATNFYGSTVLPVRAVAESLGTIVNWDAKTSTANLVKIDVNMIVCESILWKDDTYSIINVYVPEFTAEKYAYDFSVFYDSDLIPEGLLEGNYSLRTVICDKTGDILFTGSENAYIADDYGFWGGSDYKNVIFSKDGDYSLEFQMKAEGSTYQTIEKRRINVITE